MKYLLRLKAQVYWFFNSVVWFSLFACATESKELVGEKLNSSLYEEIEKRWTHSPCFELEGAQAHTWLEREKLLYRLHEERAQVRSSSLLSALQSVRRLTDCGGALGGEWRQEYEQWLGWRSKLEQLLVQKVKLLELKRSLARKNKDLRALQEVETEIQELLEGMR